VTGPPGNADVVRRLLTDKNLAGRLTATAEHEKAEDLVTKIDRIAFGSP
jgi:hypothetical protein